MPCRPRAPQAHVAAQDEPDAASPALPALIRWLQRLGVRVTVGDHRLAPDEVGEQLLSLTDEVGASLLVMGCYGHSRARLWVLGGATRTVLRPVTLPAPMVH